MGETSSATPLHFEWRLLTPRSLSEPRDYSRPSHCSPGLILSKIMTLWLLPELLFAGRPP